MLGGKASFWVKKETTGKVVSFSIRTYVTSQRLVLLGLLLQDGVGDLQLNIDIDIAGGDAATATADS